MRLMTMLPVPFFDGVIQWGEGGGERRDGLGGAGGEVPCHVIGDAGVILAMDALDHTGGDLDGIIGEGFQGGGRVDGHHCAAHRDLGVRNRDDGVRVQIQVLEGDVSAAKHDMVVEVHLEVIAQVHIGSTVRGGQPDYAGALGDFIGEPIEVVAVGGIERVDIDG
jgi:hypothetical protein